MKKIASILMAMVLLVAMVPASFAHTKPYKDCADAYSAAMNELGGLTKIRDACNDYVAAFNGGDQEAMAAAYKIITDAGLLPEQYTPDDASFIEKLGEYYGALYTSKSKEYESVINDYFFWGKHILAMPSVLQNASDNNIPIIPAQLTSSYMEDVQIDFPENFFANGKDTSGYYGDIFLIEATLQETYPENGSFVLNYDAGENGIQPIFVAQPGVTEQPDYDVSNMPAASEKGLFYLTYFGDHEEGLKMFVLGANDYVVDLTRYGREEISPSDQG